MPDLTFGCTSHSLPEDRARVSIYCEAHPESVQRDLLAEHRRRRCGPLHTRVTTICAAVSSGDCKNLGEHLNAASTNEGPSSAASFPRKAIRSSKSTLRPEACPPKVWMSGAPLINAQMQRLVEESRQTDRNDVPQKMLICRELKIKVAAVHNGSEH